MSLVIIGNGFDLHHNDPKLLPERKLKTLCSDYLRFLLDHQLLNSNDGTRALELLLEEHHIDRFFNVDLKRLVTSIRQIPKIDKKTGKPVIDKTTGKPELAPHKETWSQFESIISNWLRNPLKLKDALHSEPEKIMPIIYGSDNLRKWAQSINLKLGSVKPSQYFSDLFTNDDYFICFNYTDTLAEVYGIREDRILFVHGRASKNDSNLIMGHCTDVDSELKKERYGCVAIQKNSNETSYPPQGTSADILNQHPKLLDMIRKFYKNPEAIVQSNADFFQAISREDNIHIIGHNYNSGLGSVVQYKGDGEKPKLVRGQAFDPTDYFYYQYLSQLVPKMSSVFLYDFELNAAERYEKDAALGALWPQAKLSFPKFPSYLKVEKEDCA